jgi:hypothetical protein
LGATLRVEGSLSVLLALRVEPRSELIAVLAVRVGDARVPLALDESLQMSKALLPAGFVDGPGPPRQGFQPGATFGIQHSSTRNAPLHRDPLPEPVLPVAVVAWHPSVPLAFDEAPQIGEALLPVGFARAPNPAGHRLKSSAMLMVKGSASVCLASLVNPRAESVALLAVRVLDPCMALAFDEPVQEPEVELPGRCRLLDEAGVKGLDELSADPARGNVQLNFLRSPRG